MTSTPLASPPMQNNRPTFWQKLGVAVLAVTVGIPALEQAGFTVLAGTKLGWDLQICLTVAIVGGAVGGALLAGKHFVAGAMGGILAGPGGFLAVYFYVQNRESVRSFELMLVQLAGSLPGLGLFHILKRLGPVEAPAGTGALALQEDATA